ncbi:hypothetical protein [Anaerobutyricum soehngenii]|uniref:hypothetical protein n=1 Tax=Anaerobutyricum soehngenii TaxID=105843 RepID=UPI0032C0CABE
MVKKLVNGQVKDLTDVTIGGIKVYSCAKQENSNHNRSDAIDSHNKIDSKGDISNDTSNAKNDSTLGVMSLFS